MQAFTSTLSVPPDVSPAIRPGVRPHEPPDVPPAVGRPRRPQETRKSNRETVLTCMSDVCAVVHV